jgi:nitrogen fixation protein NifU and related proteins
MSELNELYQEVILDHNRKPRNFHKIEPADRQSEGFNPLCGDQISLFIRLQNDVITDIGFQGSGCAISKASASMMTDSVKGKTIVEAGQLFDSVHRMLTQEGEADSKKLGKLIAFEGVRQFPIRVKCASLAWHTLNAALQAKQEPVTTEEEE